MREVIADLRCSLRPVTTIQTEKVNHFWVEPFGKIKKPIFKNWFIAYRYRFSESIFIFPIFFKDFVEHNPTHFPESSVGYGNNAIVDSEPSVQNFGCTYYHQKIAFDIRRRCIIQTHYHINSFTQPITHIIPLWYQAFKRQVFTREERYFAFKYLMPSFPFREEE